jgi:N-acetyltransferase 10
MKSKMEGMLNPEFLQQYAIDGEKEEFDDALQKHGGKINPGSVISVKSNRVKPEKHGKQESSRSGKKRGKEDRGSKSNKKSKS